MSYVLLEQHETLKIPSSWHHRFKLNFSMDRHLTGIFLSTKYRKFSSFHSWHEYNNHSTRSITWNCFSFTYMHTMYERDWIGAQAILRDQQKTGAETKKILLKFTRTKGSCSVVLSRGGARERDSSQWKNFFNLCFNLSSFKTRIHFPLIFWKIH